MHNEIAPACTRTCCGTHTSVLQFDVLCILFTKTISVEVIITWKTNFGLNDTSSTYKEVLEECFSIRYYITMEPFYTDGFS